MHRLAYLVLPMSLAFTGIAFAQAPATSGTSAPPAATAQPMASHHAAAHAAAMREDRNGPQEQRLTKALNLLEANGYGDFRDFHAEGQNYAVTVTSGGKQFPVLVNPDSNQVTPQGQG